MRTSFPAPRWFPASRLNFAENLLRFSDDRVAILSVTETDPPDGPPVALTYADVYGQVAAIAAHLRARGVTAGDRVAGWLPNTPEAIVAMLATASIGAVWTSCSPDFGASGALDRFGQVAPKILFACDGYTYNGRIISIVDAVQEVAAAVPELVELIWVDRIGQSPRRRNRMACAPDVGPSCPRLRAPAF